MLKMTKTIKGTMYNIEENVNMYDTIFIKKKQKLSTFKGLSSLWLLEGVRAGRIKSVLDIGCGAGAFYHARISINANINYLGYDQVCMEGLC
jgi:tRNA G46 methylase TrmB